MSVPLLHAAFAVGSALAQPTYIGSDSCRECHWQEWSRFRGSSHAITLESDASTRPLPLPDGFDWSEISYVLGGANRKALYLGPQGRFVTTVDGAPGGNQYNLATDAWVDYHAGEQKDFDCGACHTTGYSATGHQGGLPGIVGTWALDGVQCEACHGPASNHVTPPFKGILNIKNSELCGECHSNGPLGKVPASQGFIQPNAQYNELIVSPHDDRWCVECHDPHRQSEVSIRMHCTECHEHVSMADEDTFQDLGRRHLARGVECWDCHMPYIVRSATSDGKYRGDARSHLFKITVDADAIMFKDNGATANRELTAAYACLWCHENIVDTYMAKGKPAQAEAWARKHAKKIHKKN